jgi:hypothetical protein
LDDITVIQILDRMDERTAQIAQIIATHSVALHNLARIADVMAQSLAAIQQRQIDVMKMQAHALEVSSQALQLTAAVLVKLEGRS